MRASDAERAETVDALREEFALGRLSHQTFMFRMNAAMEAKHVGDLPPLLSDLPAPPPPRPGLLGRLRRSVARLTRNAPPAVGPGVPGAAHPGYLGQGHVAQGHPAQGRDPGPGSNSPGRRLTSVIRLPAAPQGPPRTAPLPPLAFPRTAEGFFTIGRDSRNDLAIDDMTVSRIHARLERTPGGWVLKDLSSTNGTRVNGWKVRGQVTVRAGDVVRFGDIEYVLTEDGGSPGGVTGSH